MQRLTDDPEVCRELVEQSLDMLTILDWQGHAVYNNAAIERVLGHRPQDLLGASVYEYLHPNDISSTRQVIGRLRTSEVEVIEHLCRLRCSSGDYRWVASVARAWNRGGVHGLVISSRDVTERHETLQALEQSNELLSKIFSASANLLSITRPDTGVFIDVNDAWCRTLGYSRDEVIGRSSLDLNVWGDPEQRRRVIAELESRGRLRGREVVVHTRDGEPRQLVVDAEILTVSGERRYLMACTDVTEARRVEAELRQAQKMEALGQLTGGVAHDFNNLLGVILGNAELLGMRLGDQPELQRMIGTIVRACERGGSLTKQLLAFARRQPLSPESVALDVHIRRLEPILATTMGSNTRITIESAPDLWPCNVDPGQLETAILNLALNARDAMPEGGELGIRLENRSVLGDASEARMGDYVAVIVSDTGSGIAPEILDQVFEPFFTTKGPGHGTGLGLSMAFGFAKQSGGNIELDSEPGRGTRVTLLLPRGDEDAAEPGGVPKAAPRGHGETVLLVEDDDSLRALLAEQLRGLGYAVFDAGDERVVEGVLASGARVDLVMSDVVLGGRKRGQEVVADVLAARPGAAVLFMSGHLAGDAVEDVHSLIRKPFTRSELAFAVKEALERRASRQPPMVRMKADG